MRYDRAMTVQRARSTAPKLTFGRVGAALLLAMLPLVGGSAARPNDEPNLEQIISPLLAEYRKVGESRAEVVAGPAPTQMLNDRSPGRVWKVKLGEVTFKVTIQDKAQLDIQACLQRVELLPPSYRKILAIVSERDKAGLAIYSDLGDALAHGSQDYLNIVPAAEVFVLLHEAGHILEQRARATAPTLLDRWKQVATADRVSVSAYGDGAVHEDLAEFAYIYAVCLEAGPKAMDRLKQRSPGRFGLWAEILRDAEPVKD